MEETLELIRKDCLMLFDLVSFCLKQEIVSRGFSILKRSTFHITQQDLLAHAV